MKYVVVQENVVYPSGLHMLHRSLLGSLHIPYFYTTQNVSNVYMREARTLLFAKVSTDYPIAIAVETKDIAFMSHHLFTLQRDLVVCLCFLLL